VSASVSQVWDWLAAVPDPEIPAISLVDLGVIREVRYDDDTLVVAVTPTYSGCPATAIINLDIENALRAKGVEKLQLERRLSPPWTTAWVSEDGRRKLSEYGIAPPVEGSAADGRVAARIAALGRTPEVRCPRCGSSNTTKVSQFGSTPCKANYACRDCLEPFDYFKCI
jgi:ring-1,2-phenylacetyl-CoA epoxidase subunit PaaD